MIPSGIIVYSVMCMYYIHIHIHLYTYKPPVISLFQKKCFSLLKFVSIFKEKETKRKKIHMKPTEKAKGVRSAENLK